jgi:hypothetical protein
LTTSSLLKPFGTQIADTVSGLRDGRHGVTRPCDGLTMEVPP